LRFSTNNGNDDVRIDQTSIPIIAWLGAGNDRLTAGTDNHNGLDLITASITVVGESGFNRIYLNDHETVSGRTYDARPSEIRRDASYLLTHFDIDRLRIRASDQDDTLILSQYDHSQNPSLRVVFEGNGGEDSVFGPNLPLEETVWDIRRPDLTVINQAVVTTSTENLIGGFSNDRFLFRPNGRISGLVAGGTVPASGTNVLDYSRYGSDVFVNLPNSSATAIGGNFIYLYQFVGSRGGNDSLFGLNTDANWFVVGENRGLHAPVSGPVSYAFDNFENLIAGLGFDAFRFTNNSFVTGSVIGVADGAGTFDSIDFSAATQDVKVDLAEQQAGTLDRNYFAVRGIELVIGGFGNDVLIGDSNSNFLFGGPGSDLIHGGSGDDWLDGGDGADLIIGGFGSDLIFGGGNSDLVIAGDTIYDVDQLVEIRDYWRRPDLSYSERVEGLRDGIDHNDQVLFLNSDTVIDDGVFDLLFGGLGDDWFWLNPATDLAVDRVTREFIN